MADERLMKELRQIRNVLILVALKSGATSEEVGSATGMGGGNVRALFAGKRAKKGSTNES